MTRDVPGHLSLATRHASRFTPLPVCGGARWPHRAAAVRPAGEPCTPSSACTPTPLPQDIPAWLTDADRATLENEVRTLTAQGRLSAIVIALLGPVSLALLSFFPGYLDVLWQTDMGNLVLVTAGVLQIIGAAIVSHLIRVEY